jgi:hypothetical protein
MNAALRRGGHQSARDRRRAAARSCRAATRCVPHCDKVVSRCDKVCVALRQGACRTATRWCRAATRCVPHCDKVVSRCDKVCVALRRGGVAPRRGGVAPRRGGVAPRRGGVAPATRWCRSASLRQSREAPARSPCHTRTSRSCRPRCQGSPRRWGGRLRPDGGLHQQHGERVRGTEPHTVLRIAVALDCKVTALVSVFDKSGRASRRKAATDP